jgi:hypothetical protein
MMARKEGVIAFEMEGAGPLHRCHCQKGVCNYADCHKNKKLQNFAAATAASVSKAILEQYILSYGKQCFTRDSQHFDTLSGMNKRASSTNNFVETVRSQGEYEEAERIYIIGRRSSCGESCLPQSILTRSAA